MKVYIVILYGSGGVAHAQTSSINTTTHPMNLLLSLFILPFRLKLDAHTGHNSIDVIKIRA